MIPVIGTAVALHDVNTPYLTFAIFAAFSGIGGGNFASSMSNISYFFPKKVQGTSLGLNAGIGNLGVGVMQKVIPWVTGIFLFGAVNHCRRNCFERRIIGNSKCRMDLGSFFNYFCNCRILRNE
ncbi:MAG: hypothetical protein U5K00_08290 [Melioribacteraceae bacterium]|nr:hypothetical protein [Melioribacteraceae bacterium]